MSDLFLIGLGRLLLFRRRYVLVTTGRRLIGMLTRNGFWISARK